MAARKKTTDEAGAPSSKPASRPAAKKAPRKAPRKAKERDLTRELGQLLAKTLLPDLRERARLPVGHPHPEATVHAGLVRQYEAERAAKRTGDDEATWIDRVLEQIGVAWILSCAFLRTLEDRGLLTHARLAGEGALDAEHLFFDLFPSLGLRDYLLATFRELSHLPGGREVLGPAHNPAWRLAPSGEALRALVAFFRETDAEGQLVWRFGRNDQVGDTRFLGDLYQDVSEGVRERYALLQTPVFVEEFILDLTLDPAIAEYGLDAVRIIDPTCGSGHFLLGAFRRLFDRHQAASPGLSPKELAGKALAQVVGVDLNPFAAAIARFRLVLAYLDAAGIDKLKDAPELPTQVIVADSLLHRGKGQTRPLHEIAGGDGAEGGDAAAWGTELFALEDPAEARRVFGQEYHAVVGNPPYITCKDPVLREEYRKDYASAAGKYALAAPFTERFFQLAVPGGFVGLINANSFMKREFGKKLIEEVLKRLELTHVFDTSGAYIPGHGTPTVLLFGRNRAPLSSTVRAVLGKRGEPETPADAAKGLVWSDIAGQWREVGFESDYVSVVDAQRATFDAHPWSLGGGGAAELKELLEARAETRLGEMVTAIGFDAIMGEDDLFAGPPHWVARLDPAGAHRRALIVGEVVRDWATAPDSDVLFPYSDALAPDFEDLPSPAQAHLRAYRKLLIERQQFGKNTLEAGLRWFEYRSFYKSKRSTPLSLVFAFVATHNHFVLDRGGKVFNRTAPIIKLPEGATENDHLALLAYLNSSTACFWMKQVCHNKSNASQKHTTDPARAAYEFAGTALLELPIPALSGAPALCELARTLLACAERRATLLCGSTLATEQAWLSSSELRATIERTWAEYAEVTRRCTYLQEEIDWFVYRLFGLEPDEPAPSLDGAADLGARPFERAEGYDSGVTARVARPRAASGGALVAPAAWAARVTSSDGARLLEQRTFKRAWRETESNVDQLEFRARAAREWVERDCAAQLERRVRARDAACSLTTVLHAAAGRLNVAADVFGEDVAGLGRRLLEDDAVPYLAALRHTDAGLEKRAQWEKTWALQRREDAGETVSIPVPPKYDAKDYRDPGYFRLRGKLDVPKERFISYPGAEKDDDRSPLYGWAGWDHLQQATALAALYHERKTEDGWPPDRLVPLLAGLLELVPWLKQWHNAPHDDFGGDGPGDWYERYVEAEARSLGKDVDALRAWRPEKKGGRR